jgi:hypothetical protein
MTTSFLRCPLNSAASTSARAAITRPSVVRDLFMFPPSRRRVPVAPEELARSLPAKSTNLNQHYPSTRRDGGENGMEKEWDVWGRKDTEIGISFQLLLRLLFLL